jgi:flagellar biosynthesis anti-sigma factor FlgM
MKIDGNRSQVDLPVTPGRVEASRTAESRNTGAAGTSGVDTVRVSSEAQLASNAIAAVKQLPEVRPEAVARGRALLQSGTLGADASRLADAILKDLLDK